MNITIHRFDGHFVAKLDEASRLAGRLLEWHRIADLMDDKPSIPLHVCLRCGALTLKRKNSSIPHLAKKFLTTCSHRPEFDIAGVIAIDEQAEWYLVTIARCNLCNTEFTERAMGHTCPNCHRRLGVIYEGIGHASEGYSVILHAARPKDVPPVEPLSPADLYSAPKLPIEFLPPIPDAPPPTGTPLNEILENERLQRPVLSKGSICGFVIVVIIVLVHYFRRS